MLYVGSDDGVYRFDDALDRETPVDGGVPSEGTRVLESASVMRLWRLDAVDGGLYAAAASGLMYSAAGESWVDLGVPAGAVYAVGASSDGRTLYAGTRPAAVYAADVPASVVDASDGDGDAVDPDGRRLDADALEWRACEGFQALPSREHWRLPRHEDLAHVRDAKGLPGDPAGVVAAVEVGGVHASSDRGETWTERRGPITDPRPEDAPGDNVDWSARSDDSNGRDWSKRPGDVHDDVHELAVVDADTWVAATGFGLFETTDAGDSWTRLDDAVEQGYFRTVCHHDGATYAAAATSSSGNWDDPDVTSGFFAHTPDGGLRELDVPTPDEVVTGVAAVERGAGPDAAGATDATTLFAGTHRGSLLRATLEDDHDGGGDATVARDWRVVGSFPTDDDSGTYTPVAWLDD